MTVTDPEEPSITVNGVEITALKLAEARQELAVRSPFNAGFYPTFAQLSEQEQSVSVKEARNYLRALVMIAPTAPNPAAGGGV